MIRVQTVTDKYETVGELTIRPHRDCFIDPSSAIRNMDAIIKATQENRIRIVGGALHPMEPKRKPLDAAMFWPKQGEGCLFVMKNNRRLYAGGRYYAWMMALALQASGIPTSILTNRLPGFIHDFDLYEPKASVGSLDPRIGKNYEGLPRFDFMIGVPQEGQVVVPLGQKYGVPSSLMVFDPPNFIRELTPDQLAARESVWAEYKRYLAQADRVIALCPTTEDYVARWLKSQPRDKIFSIVPGINSKVADTVPEAPKRDSIIFVSRMVGFKHLDHTFKVAAQLKPKPRVVVIGGIEPENTPQSLESRIPKDSGLEVVCLPCCDDETKYRELRRARLMITPSYWE
ncbi:MAG: hypothetical protein WBE26_12980, partial [Phycisphaerae bacterium]